MWFRKPTDHVCGAVVLLSAEGENCADEGRFEHVHVHAEGCIEDHEIGRRCENKVSKEISQIGKSWFSVPATLVLWVSLALT